MSTLDLLLLGIIGAGALRGWFAGATQQLVSTVGWFVGFVLAAALMDPVGSAAAAVLGVSERTAPVVGFVLMFAAALAGVAFVGHAIRKTLEAVRLGTLDRLAGATLGGFKATLGLSVMLMVTALSPLPGGGPWVISADAREQSLLHDPLREIAPATWLLVRRAIPGAQAMLSEKFSTWDERDRTTPAAP